jgi:hypothetical protein
MSALNDVLNEKAGATGQHTIAQMIDVAESISAGITPTGNQDISTLSEYNVSTKATARISETERAKCIPGNIAQGVTLLGVTGTHITPTGNQNITTLNEYNVTSKATARISEAERAKIIADNIKTTIINNNT